MAKKLTLGKLKLKAQKVFNEYIRLRDHGKPCISCGELKTLQAGHFYPVKNYDGLRFDEDNVNGECAGCNCFDGAHLIGYSENLPKRIGKKPYQDLKERAAFYKANHNKMYRHEVEEIIEIYKQKVKDLK